jgi:hypothetical protein
MGNKLNQDITIRILLSMLDNNTFNAIQLGTERQGRWGKEKVAPRHLKKYLTQMAINRLIKEEQQGKRTKYTITRKGISYLIDNSFFDILNKVNNVISIIDAARKPEIQLQFKEELTKRRKRSEALKEKFFEGYGGGYHDQTKHTYTAKELLFGPLDPLAQRWVEYFDIVCNDSKKSNELFQTQPVEQLEEPLMKATKRMFESELFFNGQIKNPHEVIDNSYMIFMPGMRLRFAFDIRQLFKGPLPNDKARRFNEKIRELETFCREIHGDKSQDNPTAMDNENTHSK